MDFTQYVVLAAVIAGVVELITRLRAKDYWVVVTILSAAAVGGIFGAIGYYPDLDIMEGVAVGFGASGALTAVSLLGNKSVAHESKPFERA